MKAGILNIKIVPRKLQGNSNSTQYILLAGFTPALTHTTADHVETLSPNHVLQQAEIDLVIAKLVGWTNAAGFKNITPPGVQKKLEKLFTPEVTLLGELGRATFAGMGIGRYEEAPL